MMIDLGYECIRTERIANASWEAGGNTNNYILGDFDLLRLSRMSSLLWLLLPRLTDRERERLLLLLLLYLE